MHRLESQPSRIVLDDQGPGILSWQIADAVYSLATNASEPATAERSSPRTPDQRLLMAARLAAGALFITEARCITEAVSHPCLHGYYRADSSGLESHAHVGLPDTPINSRRATSPSGVYLAHGYDGARITLTAFTPDTEGSISVTQQPLGQRIPPTEEPVEVLGLTARGERWAALWRFGAEESSSGEVVLSLADSESAAPLLRHAISIDTMLWRRASIMIVAGFEFARPALFRIATNGRPRWLPRAIPHEGHLPEPYDQRYNARLRPSDDGPKLEVTSAAGDPLRVLGPFGDTWTLEERLVTTSRHENGFSVAYVERDAEAWLLKLSRLHCSPRTP